MTFVKDFWTIYKDKQLLSVLLLQKEESFTPLEFLILRLYFLYFILQQTKSMLLIQKHHF